MTRKIYNLNDLINQIAQARRNPTVQDLWNTLIDRCEPEVQEMGNDSLKINEPGHPFNLAEDIKKRRERIAQEQKELEEAEKQYDAQMKKIRYIGNDKQLQMLVPREKMEQLIKGLTEVIKKEPNAKNYKITINL